MSEEKRATIEDVLGQAVYGVDSRLRRIEAILSGAGALGEALYKMRIEDELLKEGNRFMDSQRIMCGLYDCLETIAIYGEENLDEVREMLGIDESGVRGQESGV